MNLDDILRAKISRDYNSNESTTMFTTLKKREKNWDENTLVGEVLGPDETKLTSVKMLSGPKKKKKSGEMLVMNKAFCPDDHDDLLMDRSVWISGNSR